MAGKVRLVNNQRDTKHMELHEFGADGDPKRAANGHLIMREIVLGSRDDDGVEGVAQPDIELSGTDWDQLCLQPAVRGMIEKRHIAAYPLG